MHTFIGGAPPTLYELHDRYRHQVVGRSTDGSQSRFNWVPRRRDTGAAVGTVQAMVSTKKSGRLRAELGWVVGAAYQGQGFAKEGVRALATWLREQGVTSLVAHVHPQHEASIAVAQSIGLEPSEITIDGKRNGAAEMHSAQVCAVRHHRHSLRTGWAMTPRKP